MGFYVNTREGGACELSRRIPQELPCAARMTLISETHCPGGVKYGIEAWLANVPVDRKHAKAGGGERAGEGNTVEGWF